MGFLFLVMVNWPWLRLDKEGATTRNLHIGAWPQLLLSTGYCVLPATHYFLRATY